MLLTMVIVLGTPENILDDELREMCEHLYRVSLATHVLCFIFKLIVFWGRAMTFKPMQVIETFLVILHVYLMLLSIETFAKL